MKIHLIDISINDRYKFGNNIKNRKYSFLFNIKCLI